MDFFEAQARARKRTSRLVVLFALAVIGTIVAMYAAASLIIGQTGRRPAFRSRNSYYSANAGGGIESVWQPQLFAGVTFATLAIVGLGSLYKWGRFSAGGRAVAESVDARRVDPHTRDLKERRLLNVVEEMAIASGIPVPAVYVMDQEQAINAFAAGLTTSDAIVAVTRGTLDKLTRDELQGVVGHEFSHILNGDMRLNLRLAALVFGILVLGLIGRSILWSLRRTRVRGKNAGAVIVIVLAVGISLVVIGYFGYFFGRLIQAAVSRQREFLADASAVQFTRNPGGIVGALKKIGGHAPGSTVQSDQSAAIGHFFFAQAFRTGITGLWATHPPLEQRIRAIDPSFDGKFIEPPEVVDAGEGSAGFAPGRPASAAGAPATPAADGGATESTGPTPLLPSITLAAVGSIGTLTPEQIASAQVLLDSTPAPLRDAAHSPDGAPVLLFGLLLDPDPQICARQRKMISDRAGAEALPLLDAMEPFLRSVRDEHKLPLLQLALPAIRELPADALDPFLATLDDLVHADNRVSPFEYALQKLLTRTLALGRTPGSAIIQYYSFNAVINEISIVLSMLARSSSADAAFAPRAFAAGAAQIKLIETNLRYRPDSAAGLAELDAALDKLARASLPIKQRTLIAAAAVVRADGRVRVCEFELLRAVAAALDVPMPPLAAAA